MIIIIFLITFFFFPSRDFIFQPIPTLVFDFNVLDLVFLNISIYRFFPHEIDDVLNNDL